MDLRAPSVCVCVCKTMIRCLLLTKAAMPANESGLGLLRMIDWVTGG